MKPLTEEELKLALESYGGWVESEVVTAPPLTKDAADIEAEEDDDYDDD